MPARDTNSAADPSEPLAQLATDLVDVVDGYETMARKADGDLKPIVDRLFRLHQAHVSDVLQIIDDLGGRRNEAGSAMGSVHSAVATLRDLVGALDKSALGAILDGEERLVHSYDTALQALDGHPDIRRRLAGQRDTLRAEISALRA